MEFVNIENGIVTEHICSNKQPEGETWKKIEKFYGHVGIKESWINWNTGIPYSIEELVANGLAADNRGDYWDTTTKEKKTITEIDTEPDLNWTSQEPINDPFCIWSETQKQWVIDEVAKLPVAKEQYCAGCETHLLELFEQGFAFNGFEIQGDKTAQANVNAYLTAVTSGVSVTYPIIWRTRNNQFMELANEAMFKTFAGAMLLFVQSQYIRIWQAKDSIRAADTLSKADAIHQAYMDK